MSEIPRTTGGDVDFAKLAEWCSGRRNDIAPPSSLMNDPGDRLAPTDLRGYLLKGMSAKERKTYPLYEGVFGYFYNALLRVAHVSYIGNEQHNPGQPLHWARGKSKDQLDCMLRHAGEYAPDDYSDASEEAGAAMCWRALAEFELYLERKYNLLPPKNARSED